MAEIVTEKRCSKCGGIRDWGRRAMCKACMSVYNKEYHLNHLETERARNKEWRENNKERKRETCRAYRQAHKREYIEYERARNHRIRANFGSFTPDEWRELCNKYDNKCVCCRLSKILTADHVVPVILGGSSFIENIQPLCRSCNSKKGILTIDYRW